MSTEPLIIYNTPSLFIPKELFKEEKLNEYWNVLCGYSQQGELGKDDLENYTMLYVKPKNCEATHETTHLYKMIKEKFPEQLEAVCINVYDDTCYLLVLKDNEVAFSGYFHYTVNEDVLYHIVNITQHFFENNFKVTFFYQQLSPAILRLLNEYFEIKKL